MLVATAGGCQALQTLVILIKGTDLPPDYPGLKDKKVVVVCRPMVDLQYANAAAAKDLAAQMGKLLQAKVSKIKVVDQQKVAAWMDENNWDDYPVVGKALGADMVVAVDLNSFGVYEGQTLFRGKASASLKVYDMKKSGKIVYEKNLPQSLYPPNSAIPVSNEAEAEFRHEFIGVLADQIARHFYEHDPHADLGQDCTAGLK